MRKKIIIIFIFCLTIMLLVGCKANNDYKAIFKGETENWEAEMKYLKEGNFEDMIQYGFTLSYKNNLDELTFLNNINVGYIWFIQDAELISNKSLPELLDYSYDDVKANVVYEGDDEEPNRLFDIFKTEMPVWEEPEDNKEYTVAFIMPNDLFDKMANEIEFVVEWGNNTEIFKLFKID